LLYPAVVAVSKTKKSPNLTMNTINIQNLFGKEIKAERGVTILQNLQNAQVDWMHACGGKGRCTTCKARIIEGMESLSGLNEAEKRYAEMGRLKENERMCCQAKIEREDAAVTIEVLEHYKMPHLTYSN
jgi:2Fe-2S ferredoxin